MLRAPAPRDRAAAIELNASPEVCAYIGGAQPREVLERTIPEVQGNHPGQFAVELGGTTIGIITLNRRDARHEAPPVDGKVELGYLFLPDAWGSGYATEACTAALRWFSSAVPGEPVVLTTQTANERSVRLAQRLGFTEAERFEAHGAEQLFAVREPAPL